MAGQISRRIGSIGSFQRPKARLNVKRVNIDILRFERELVLIIALAKDIWLALPIEVNTA